jgi:uncharacterized protein
MDSERFNKIFINPRLDKSINGFFKIDYAQNNTSFYMTDFNLKKLIKSIYDNLNSATIQFNWVDNLNYPISVEFYNKVVILQNNFFGRYNYFNVIETSIFLISYNAIKFFSENEIMLRIVIKESLFENRDKEDLKLVEKKISLLRKHNIAFDVKIVCEDCEEKFAETIYEFLKNNEIYWSSLCYHACNCENTVNPEKYGDFLCKIFDIWYSDFEIDIPSNNIFIDLFDSILYFCMNGVQTLCKFKTQCESRIFIDAEGNVYPCNYFRNEKDLIGNLLSGNLFLIINSNKLKEFRQRKSNISYQCKLCKWKRICNGGCPKARIRNSADKERTYLCDAYKQFFEYTYERFFKITELFKSQKF